MEWSIGQKVAIHYSTHGRDAYEIGIIERFTPSGRIVVLGDVRRHFLPNGRKIGNVSWGSAYIEELTPEIEMKVRRAALLSKIKTINWSERSLEILEQVLKLVG